MKRFIRRFKKKRQFKKDMKHWIRLCKYKSTLKVMGLQKVGEITHKIDIKNVGIISTRNPIFISCE